MASLNWPLIRQTCGKLLLLESAFMATATLVAVYFWWTQGEQDVMALAIPSLCCFITGWLLTLSNRHVSPHVTQREGFCMALTVWRATDFGL